MSLKDQLVSGKEYKLPVKIYTYNGTSIRTTVGIDNYDQALRIKAYNERLHKENLRKTNFLDSKILWVPFSELNCTDKVTGETKEPLTSSPSPKKKSGNYLCDLPIPESLFEEEIFVSVGRSMLKRFQMEGQTLESELVSDRLLLNYSV